jgi:hypothetical protein
MKRLLFVILFMFIPALVWAGAYETITVSTAAIGFTSTSICPTTHACYTKAYCSVISNDIRLRFDGTAPTSTTGHKIVGGSNITFTLTGESALKNALMIKDTASAGDGTVNCSYE